MKNGIILDIMNYSCGVLVAVVTLLSGPSVGLGWLNISSWLAIFSGGVMIIVSLGVAALILNAIYKDIQKKYLGGKA